MDKKKLITRMPEGFHRHLVSVSSELNIGVQQFVIESLLKELKSINREYATPEDFRFRKFEVRHKKND
ncbi:hypothetical protein LGN04_02070 [Burkholderia multivorans]|uniref:hypothetical protein n=1 Tax=Burkholderia multivorans TaxID=87883 RepID=UPI001C23FE2F|nr:hypothetical protein [Burkholderia multivorans]MBU9434131.1 hypothetical protein [Burkholderia multivorans]MCA8452704.1 hypothetical protein [Burkholderia multivorans]MDN7873509.1 hypothetical protein [Burkholderia multivorans]MDN8018117.1 hypothetical protein [Burkholderia multivorans]